MHDIRLHICRDCGFVQILNVVPEKELYSKYALQSTWKPQPHLMDEIRTLRDTGALTNGSFVLEVGCNDGSALLTLQKEGVKSSLGIEPSTDMAQIAVSRKLNVINDYFTASLAERIRNIYGSCDLMICRQVLEHVSQLDDFMFATASIIRDNGYLLFEVPDFSVPLQYGDISAVWEEHVNYFTENSLKYLLQKYGFIPVLTARYNFSGGALTVIAKRLPTTEAGEVNHLINEYDSNILFGSRTEQFRQKIISYIRESGYAREQIAVYGAGNRTVILLNYFLNDVVSFVVDDQPEKQNHFLPQCHKPVYSSEALAAQNIKLCLLAVNAENEETIIRRHAAYIDAGGVFVSLLSPSERMI